MHPRRLACFLLGTWLGASILLSAVAAYNFQTVDEVLLAAPEPARKMLQAIGQAQARQLLRHHAAEANRNYFEAWELAQLPLGLALLTTLALNKASRLQIALSAIMLVSVVVARFLLTPELTGVGRMLDFEAPSVAVALLKHRFAAFHRMYGAVELIKLSSGVLLTGLLLYRSVGSRKRRRSDLREQVDAVHDADNRHVDRG